MTYLPQAKDFDWKNLVARATSGAVLAACTLGAVWVFGWRPPLWRAPFLMMISVGGVLLSLEWAAMATPRDELRAAMISSIAVVAVILLAFTGQFLAAWACVVAGAMVVAAATRKNAEHAIDGAYGVFYIAPACLVLTWLIGTSQGRGWTVMLFAVTWSADIGAFLVGNAIKGPKLWPRFSPNKTWSGFVGGLLASMFASVAVAAGLMHLSLVGAGLIGLCGGLATMAGDLWESMLKRRFGVKDTGDLIPGHGGLLDRVDGLMFAVMAFAVARLVVHWGWTH